jgi:hypothetical protein
MASRRYGAEFKGIWNFVISVLMGGDLFTCSVLWMLWWTVRVPALMVYDGLALYFRLYEYLISFDRVPCSLQYTRVACCTVYVPVDWWVG